MSSYVLYTVGGSGNALKARMMLGFLSQTYEKIEPSLKPASADLLAVNSLGQVPVLVDNADPSKPVVVRDSNAILVYLATKHGAANWYPINDPVRLAKVAEWQSYATHEITDSLLWVRISNRFQWPIPVTYEEALSRARNVLSYLDHQLEASGHPWLVPGDHPTIADVAVFPYVALAESSSSGAIALSEYPHVVAWIERVKALPNMTEMPPW